MSKQILFFTYWYPGEKNPNKGVYVKRHAHALATQNAVTVVSVNIYPGKSLFRKKINVYRDEKNIETHEILLESRYYKLLYVSLPLQKQIVLKYLRKNFRSRTFDFVHSNITFPCAIIGKKLAAYFRCKHVITEHWSKLDKFFKVSLYAAQGRKALNNAHALTVVSATLKGTLEKHTTNKNIHIVPNIVDSSEFYYKDKTPKYKVLTFIAVAKWTAPKNPMIFIDALNHLSLSGKLTSFQLVMVGDGPQLDLIRNAQLHFPLICPGNLTPPQLRDEFGKSHIFLHASDYETFSVVIAEALKCGLPSIVSPVGIAPEVITEANGFVVENESALWSEKILMCTKKQYNHAAIAADISSKYTVSSVAEAFEKAYNSR